MSKLYRITKTVVVNKNQKISEIKGHNANAQTGASLKTPVSAKAKAAKPSQSPRKPSLTDVHRAPAKVGHGHVPQPAKTLMRHAVHKPAASLKRRIKAVGVATTKPVAAPAAKHPARQIDTGRLQHAKQVKKSTLISRFGKLEPTRPAPAGTVVTPVSPITFQPTAPATHRKTKHPQTTAELLQHALELASSHEQPPVKPRSKSLARRIASRRITGISAMVVAAGLLIGFVLYANATSIRLHVASQTAGFAASLPAYQPSGYRLSHLTYSPGTVAIQFQSNSDDRTYAITEQSSAWDSQTLRDNLLSRVGEDYQTVESAGRILYLYGQNNATWVSSGVWYQVKTDGALSAHQLLELASSL